MENGEENDEPTLPAAGQAPILSRLGGTPPGGIIQENPLLRRGARGRVGWFICVTIFGSIEEYVGKIIR